MENNNKSVRRVGTFTMGLYLIVAGVLAICATFQPNFDFMFLLKLTPIVFVFLGIEVLIYHFALKTEKIKYDIFSIFICFILIGATICTACVPWAISTFGPERYIKTEQLRNEIYDKCYDRLKDIKGISKLDADIYFKHPMTNYSNITSEGLDTHLTVTLVPAINTSELFAKTCKDILDNINDIDCNRITFKAVSNDKHMVLNVYDKFSRSLDVITLESMIESTDE